MNRHAHTTTPITTSTDCGVIGAADTAATPAGRRRQRWALRTLAAVLLACSLSVGALVVDEPQPAEAHSLGWLDEVNKGLLRVGYFFGGWTKDAKEGKTGPGGPYSDFKKYGFVGVTALITQFIGMQLPDPASQFRSDVVVALDRLAAGLAEVNGQLDRLQARANEITAAIEDFELAMRSNTVAEAIAPIVTEFEGPRDPYFGQWGSLRQRMLDNPDDPDTLSEEEYQARMAHYYLGGMHSRVAGSYQSFRTTAPPLLALDADILDGRLGTDAEAEWTYYQALWTSAMYFDRVAAMAANMLQDYWIYVGTQVPGGEIGLDFADDVVDQYYEFRRSLYETVGHPIGDGCTDDSCYRVDRVDDDEWVLYPGDTADPRYEWYGFNGAESVPLDDFSFGPAGRPSLHSAVWNIEVTANSADDIELLDGDGSADAGPHVMLYDGQTPVGRADAMELFYPGPDVTEVTLGFSTDDIDPNGWTLVPVPEPDGDPFLRWSGDHRVTEPTKVSTKELSWSFFEAEFAQPWSRIDASMSGPGTIELWEEGEYSGDIDLAYTEGDDIWMLVANHDAEVALTSDPDVASSVDMALLARDTSVLAWSPTIPSGEHLLDVAPGDVLDLHVATTDTEMVGIDVTTDGLGTVDVILDGTTIHTIDDAQRVQVPSGPATLASTPEDVPADGLVVLATPDPIADMIEWTGTFEHDSTAPLDIDIADGDQVIAVFEEQPAIVDVTVTGEGSVEAYIDGGLAEIITDSGSVAIYGEEIALVDDRQAVPNNGAALVAIPTEGTRLTSWRGAHSSPDDATLSIERRATKNIEAVLTARQLVPIDQTASRIGGKSAQHAAGTMSIDLQTGGNWNNLVVYEDTYWFGHPIRTRLQINHLDFRIDGTELLDIEYGGNFSTQDLWGGLPQNSSITAVTGSVDPGNGVVTLEVSGADGHSATMVFDGDPITAPPAPPGPPPPTPSEPPAEDPPGEEGERTGTIVADASRVGSVVHGAQRPQHVAGMIAVDADGVATIAEGPITMRAEQSIHSWVDRQELVLDALDFTILEDGSIVDIVAEGRLEIDEGSPATYALGAVSGTLNAQSQRVRLVIAAEGKPKDSELTFALAPT